MGSYPVKIKSMVDKYIWWELFQNWEMWNDNELGKFIESGYRYYFKQLILSWSVNGYYHLRFNVDEQLMKGSLIKTSLDSNKTFVGSPYYDFAFDFHLLMNKILLMNYLCK